MLLMKINKSLLTVLAVVLLVLCACSTTPKESPLAAIADNLNLEMAKTVEQAPEFLDSVNVSYSDGIFTVKAALADSLIDVRQCGEALVEYFTALELKRHPGKNLDDFVNTITKEEGSFEIILSGTTGDSRTYTIGASRLRNLVKLSPSQLGYQEARANVLEILASRVAFYRADANAQDAEFEVANKFASYTIVFANTRKFANQTPGTLKSHYLKILHPRYEAFGPYEATVKEMLKSMQIDGYRFIYANGTGKDAQGIKVALPWRSI